MEQTIKILPNVSMIPQIETCTKETEQLYDMDN